MTTQPKAVPLVIALGRLHRAQASLYGAGEKLEATRTKLRATKLTVDEATAVMIEAIESGAASLKRQVDELDGKL